MERLNFIDTHVHFNDSKHANLHWDWLAPEATHPILGDIDGIKHERYSVDEFEAETRFSNVTKVVHVQADIGSPDPVDETAWLQQLADETGVPQGIVADAPLQSLDAESVLERHVHFANVRGIRDFGEGDYLHDPAFERGYALLEKYDLVFDLDTTWEKMPAAKRLAQRHEATTLVVDHCGFPRARDDEYFAAWKQAIHDLAEANNVIMKISGLGMFDPRWTVDSFRPWILECIEAFGAQRCVFGTNWFVDRLYSSYPDLIDAYRQIIKDFSHDEQVAMFSANAERVFRI